MSVSLLLLCLLSLSLCVFLLWLLDLIFGGFSFCLFEATTRLSMAPSIRSLRVVSNGGPRLSVARDLTCFTAFSAFYELCLKNA